MSPLQLQFWHYGSFKSVNHCLLFGTNSILVGLCVLVPIVLQDFFFSPAEYCVIKTLNIFTLCFFFFLFLTDTSVAVLVPSVASFPMDLRVGERVMRPGSDTALLTPLHPPLLLTPFSPQPRTSFSQQQLHQHIRVIRHEKDNRSHSWSD